MEASSHPVHALPFEGKLVPWKEHLLRGRDPVTLAADHIFRDLEKSAVNFVILPEPDHTGHRNKALRVDKANTEK